MLVTATSLEVLWHLVALGMHLELLGLYSPNVAHLSTFIACDVHAIAFPLRWSWQGFLPIAQLCQAISYLDILLFRFWCIVCMQGLRAMHYVLSPYDGP